MDTLYPCTPEVMLVCRNGHVVADWLNSFPERAISHCDRCGAETLDCCPTCGQPLVVGMPAPGLVTVGRWQPPAYCGSCGGAFPWTANSSAAPDVDSVLTLISFLRRWPGVIRQLRYRETDRPPFRIEDERDLQDLCRALLPLQFDHVRQESRTPRYSSFARTDFHAADDVTVTIKRTSPKLGERELAAQLEEDFEHYLRLPGRRTLVVWIYDPEGRLHPAAQYETAWSRRADGLDLRCVVSTC